MEDRQKKILWVAVVLVLVLNLLVIGWLLSDLFTGADDLPETEAVSTENTEGETTEATETPETEEPTTEAPTTSSPATEEPKTEGLTTEEATTEEPTTEEPTTEEPTTEAVVIEPGNIHLEETVMATDELVQVLPLDQTLLVDLDGDGILEKVTVREGEGSRYGHGQDKFHFQINELYYHGTAGFGTILPGGYLTADGVPFYVIDIDTSDAYREIAIYKSSGDGTYIFRYHEGELIPIGCVAGVPTVEMSGMGELKVNGDGTLNIMSRYDVLQPSFITKNWKLMNPHLFHASLENVVPEYYEFELRPAERKLVLKQEMVFYAKRNGNPDELITLPAGTKVDIARFYPDGGWIQILYEEDTKEVWLKRVGWSLLLPMNIFESDIMDYIDGMNLAG